MGSIPRIRVGDPGVMVDIPRMRVEVPGVMVGIPQETQRLRGRIRLRGPGGSQGPVPKWFWQSQLQVTTGGPRRVLEGPQARVAKETWGGPSEVTLGSQGSDFGGSQAVQVKGSRGSGLGSQRGPSGSQGSGWSPGGSVRHRGCHRVGGRALTSSWSSICCLSFSMIWLCWLISSSWGAQAGPQCSPQGLQGGWGGIEDPGGSWELPGGPVFSLLGSLLDSQLGSQLGSPLISPLVPHWFPVGFPIAFPTVLPALGC